MLILSLIIFLFYLWQHVCPVHRQCSAAVILLSTSLDADFHSAIAFCLSCDSFVDSMGFFLNLCLGFSSVYCHCSLSSHRDCVIFCRYQVSFLNNFILFLRESFLEIGFSMKPQDNARFFSCCRIFSKVPFFLFIFSF